MQFVIAQRPGDIQAPAFGFIELAGVSDRLDFLAGVDVVEARHLVGGAWLDEIDAVVRAQADRGGLVLDLLGAVQRGNDQVLGQVVGVLGHVETGVVVGEVAAGQVFAAMRKGRIVPARPVGLVLGAILDRGQFQRLVVGDVPVQLAGPARVGVGVVVPAGGRSGHAEVAGAVALAIGLLALDIGEQEQAILDQRAAGPDPRGRRTGAVVALVGVHLAVRPVLGGGAGRVLAGVPVTGFRVVLVLLLALQAHRGPANIGTAMPLIATTLGDDVDHAAGGAAEFGAVSAGEHLLLVDGPEWQALVAQVVQRVGDRIAIDEIGILGARGTTETDEAGAGRGNHAGCEQGDAGDVLQVPAHRQPFDVRGGEHRAHVGLRHVQRGKIALHGHRIQGLGVCAGGGDEVDLCATGDLHQHVTLGDGGTIFLQFDLVLAGRQRERTVLAVGTDADGAGQAGIRVADDHGLAGLGAAVDAAGDVGLGRGQAAGGEQYGQGQRAERKRTRVHGVSPEGEWRGAQRDGSANPRIFTQN